VSNRPFLLVCIAAIALSGFFAGVAAVLLPPSPQPVRLERTLP